MKKSLMFCALELFEKWSTKEEPSIENGDSAEADPKVILAARFFSDLLKHDAVSDKIIRHSRNALTPDLKVFLAICQS